MMHLRTFEHLTPAGAFARGYLLLLLPPVHLPQGCHRLLPVQLPQWCLSQIRRLHAQQQPKVRLERHQHHTAREGRGSRWRP